MVPKLSPMSCSPCARVADKIPDQCRCWHAGGGQPSSFSGSSRVLNPKSNRDPLKPVFKIKREKVGGNPLVSMFMSNQFFKQILILKELERRKGGKGGCLQDGTPTARGWPQGLAEVHRRPTFHQQQDKLLTPRIFPTGWFSTIIRSDSGHFCCLRPGRTTHWQATCVTTEFCRISTTCTDLDNVFFQKPGLRFKQSIILPAYQFPQDCEEGKEKTQSHDAFSAAAFPFGA